MRKVVTTLEKHYDRNTFEHVQRVVGHYKKAGARLDSGTKIDYIRHLRHQCGWSFKLIGEALGIAPATASRLLKSWQDETYGPE